VDGPDWERPKWGPIARRMLRLSALIAARWADELIIDNRPSIDYFRQRFGVEGTYIAYGADQDPPTDTGYLDSLGLEPRSYLLFVGALVPDKGADVLIDAYRRVDTDKPLVIVGDSPFASSYRRALSEAASRDPRIRMLGYVYGERYRQLLAHAYAYAHPLRSDGTSPALLQAMGFGSCIVVNSLTETLSAVGDAALAYARDDPEDLARKLELILLTPELARELRERARRRAEREYDWNAVASAHAAVYARHTQRVRSGGGAPTPSGTQLGDP
jgi:glycosyltransferase involved in cell wall biosynthesis